jgi:thiol:disulfide interchange protein DsbA
MKIFKFGSLITFFASGLLAASVALATPQLGKEYSVVTPPQPTETGKKIEVLEIFFYGCPHCFDLEPILNAWVATLPPDVAFRRMPAIFRDNWTQFAKTFYTLEALGLLEKIHTLLFNAIHLQGVEFANDDALFNWMQQHGVDRKQFADMYNSFSVQSKTMRARQLTREYGISGVPSIIVDGKYLTSSSMAGGHQGVPGVVNYLIDLARKDRAAKRR